MDIPSFNETLHIAESEPLITPSFGIHPWNAWKYADRLDQFSPLLEQSPAIGEIGLDHRFEDDLSKYPAQYPVFNFFLDAAEKSGKLINVHTSGAESQILDLLKNRNLASIIIHWYSGPLRYVQDFLDLGAYFTIGVEVSKSTAIQKLAATLPLDRILTETDNPSGWKWLHGETGFPSLIESVETYVAQIRGISRKSLSENVYRNFRSVLKAGGL